MSAGDRARARWLFPLALLAATLLLWFAFDRARDTSAVPGAAIPGARASTTQGLPAETTDIDPYLGIPAVVQHPNAHLLAPYVRLQRGVRVRYLGNLFSANQPDLIWVPDSTGGVHRLRWETYGYRSDGSGLGSIAAGDVLRIADDRLYDFNVGTLFVRVLNERSGQTGYTLLETVVGDCDPADGALWVAREPERLLARATRLYSGHLVYPISSPTDLAVIERAVEVLRDPDRYPTDLNGGMAEAGVHPVYAANTVFGVLMRVLQLAEQEPRRAEMIDAARTFFDAWVIPQAVETGAGIVSWPYRFDWTELGHQAVAALVLGIFERPLRGVGRAAPSPDRRAALPRAGTQGRPAPRRALGTGRFAV
jgi:hypothetical protein